MHREIIFRYSALWNAALIVSAILGFFILRHLNNMLVQFDALEKKYLPKPLFAIIWGFFLLVLQALSIYGVFTFKKEHVYLSPISEHALMAALVIWTMVIGLALTWLILQYWRNVIKKKETGLGDV